MDDMIKVLVVDDSPVQRSLLSYILSNDGAIEVVPPAKNGEDALKILEGKKVDIILMDINMPGMSGFTTSKKILEKYPVPIIMISAVWDVSDAKEIIKSMELGVVAALKKPEINIEEDSFRKETKYLIDAVKEFSEIKIVRRPDRSYRKNHESKYEQSCFLHTDIATSIIIIGSSAGGPPALKDLLMQLDETFSVPIIISQHMTDGFCDIFASWLDKECKIKVKTAVNGESLNNSTVYVVPNDMSLDIDDKMHIVLDKVDEKIVLANISITFKNIIKKFGEKVLGIILSGMGKDGVDQLKILHDMGGVTIAQDEKSSIVYGMPFEAVNSNAAKYILSPPEIGEFLKNNIKVEKD